MLSDKQKKKLLNTIEFKLFLFDLIEECGMCRTTHEEQRSLHLEGQRSLGMTILGWFSDEPGAPFDVIADAILAQAQTPKEQLDDRSNRYDELGSR